MHSTVTRWVLAADSVTVKLAFCVPVSVSVTVTLLMEIVGKVWAEVLDTSDKTAPTNKHNASKEPCIAALIRWLKLFFAVRIIS
jgi:hypothetical protein